MTEGYTEECSSVNSCSDMAKAIIAQAVEDVTVKWNSENSETHYRPSDNEIKKSMFFLTHKNGPWHESRVIVCYAAGLDPEYVRVKTIQAIERGDEYRLSDYSSDYEIDDEAENDLSDEEW